MNHRKNIVRSVVALISALGALVIQSSGFAQLPELTPEVRSNSERVGTSSAPSSGVTYHFGDTPPMTYYFGNTPPVTYYFGDTPNDPWSGHADTRGAAVTALDGSLAEFGSQDSSTPTVPEDSSAEIGEDVFSNNDLFQFHTTGAPAPGDGGFFTDFHDPPLFRHELLEFVPSLLTRPNDPLGNAFARLLHSERDELDTELHDHHLGIQYIPERPPLIVEWNERFLGPGELAQGIEIPTGAAWRPALWVWGETRSAIQYFDNGEATSISEWSNRFDLFAQLNLTGTERLVYGVRPVDEENPLGTARRFAGIDLNEGGGLPGGNFDTQTFFFEGDIGEVFPMLDPYDYKRLDLGFSMGRMPLLAQQGLLINEDRIDAVTLTRNTGNGFGNLNLRTTGVFAWDQLTRNSPIVGIPNIRENNSKMFALLTESDFFKNTINADVAYVDGDAEHGGLIAFGLSAIRRHYLQHNTYNTSIHVLGSFPTDGRTEYADQGELLFGQLSWTPHHYFDLIYLNAFLAVDQFTSPARGPLQGGPLGQTGLIFAAAGIGRYGAPISVKTNNVAGASLGYQWFFDETRKQVIWEIGGVSETRGQNRGAIGSTMQLQCAYGQHSIFVLSGFVAKHESSNTGAGARTEWRVKF